MLKKPEKTVDKTIISGIIRANETEILLIMLPRNPKCNKIETVALLHSLAERK